jgi:hypothetical protein
LVRQSRSLRMSICGEKATMRLTLRFDGYVAAI